ncbi:MAG: DoxX family protein [Bacteroidia bacterium]|nr:DoxX family membrane protein [Bacteroidia bacterium]MDW8332617.1 DoxX family protein [Bacteroidia bacterium]
MKIALLWLFRALVAALFLFSGLIKVNDVSGFAYKLEEYFWVFEKNFGLPAAPFVAASFALAAFIAVFETALAFALIFGVLPSFTAWALLIMIVFFTFLTGYSWITESVTDCGCFGDAIKLTPFQSFVKDVILTVVIGYIFVLRKSIRPPTSDKIARASAATLSLLTAFLTWYCYRYLPIKDFLPACKGCDFKKNATFMDAEGNTKLHGYAPVEECGFDEFSGKTLFVVVRDLAEASEEDLKTAVELTNALVGGEVKPVFLISAISRDVEAFKAKYAPRACISVQDATMLKTIVRSNPGYILLNDGVVKQKWSKAAAPTREKLLSAARD